MSQIELKPCRICGNTPSLGGVVFDEYSRTKDFEGRRIEPIDGGWKLLNHEKYRSIRDEEVIMGHHIECVSCGITCPFPPVATADQAAQLWNEAQRGEVI